MSRHLWATLIATNAALWGVLALLYWGDLDPGTWGQVHVFGTVVALAFHVIALPELVAAIHRLRNTP